MLFRSSEMGEEIENINGIEEIIGDIPGDMNGYIDETQLNGNIEVENDLKDRITIIEEQIGDTDEK